MLILMIGLFLFCIGQQPTIAKGDCDFSRYHPLKVSDFGENSAVTKVEPEYPAKAKEKHLSGIVTIKILVDKEGHVERTCPFYPPGKPKPARILVAAAEAAARQWVFKPNFGFQKDWDSKSVRFLEVVLAFEFILPRAALACIASRRSMLLPPQPITPE